MSIKQKLENPYLNKFESIVNKSDRFSALPYYKRQDLVKKYAWAVPDENAIEKIVSYSPIVEIGAGSGYWAWLIEQAGGDIICYDKSPWDDSYSEVSKAEESAVNEHADRSLFLCWPPLCWPPLSTDMGSNALSHYEGDAVLYIGEGKGGCTANDEFHRKLEIDYNLEEVVDIPQWPSVYDSLYIYKR